MSKQSIATSEPRIVPGGHLLEVPFAISTPGRDGTLSCEEVWEWTAVEGWPLGDSCPFMKLRSMSVGREVPVSSALSSSSLLWLC